ncbi:MAG: riboflavin synthase [Candidatus Cloacimonetes bacterium]|nr:riboflavin synthase [Candidatus Cloacimonadota bacterium]MCB5288133.1 riboflavin synthase [Candidatus Cloacimonadota bacterium]MCK9185449.1 riboflavin synthase [Candidatus Cloacimonadota bacterium]MDY0230457.1 riboflavin synthase [Candidatus Cloacimonadaceae bacterium]
MFTGIIEAISPIESIVSEAGSKYIQIARPESFDDLKVGSSVACNGICLTVLKFDRNSFTVQVMNETVLKSTAASWKNGEILNLERALKIGDRLDGHWVQGHIDRAVKFLRKEQKSQTMYYHFELHHQDKRLMIPQGSIAINGISLTVASLGSREFSVALIKHTAENSNMDLVKAGELVNLEYDALGKYVLRSKL